MAYDRSLAFKVCYASKSSDNSLTVVMWVKNVGSVPQTYATRMQSLLDDQGRVFAPGHGQTARAPFDRISDVDLNTGVSTEVEIVVTVADQNDYWSSWSRSADQSYYRLWVRSGPGSPGTVIRLVGPMPLDC